MFWYNWDTEDSYLLGWLELIMQVNTYDTYFEVSMSLWKLSLGFHLSKGK